MMDLDINYSNPAEYIRQTEETISILQKALGDLQSQTFSITQEIFSVQSQIISTDILIETLLNNKNLSAELEKKTKIFKDLSNKIQLLTKIYNNCIKFPKPSNKKHKKYLTPTTKLMKSYSSPQNFSFKA